MDYLWVKWIHILSSTLLFGTGLGIALFMWMAHRTGDVSHIARTARVVVLADTFSTAPAVIIQFVTGVWLVQRLGYPWSLFWIRGALLLFFVTGACWLPVVWLQIRAKRLAQQAVEQGRALPQEYHRAMHWWFALGWPAFIAVIAIFWLMVVKPV